MKFYADSKLFFLIVIQFSMFPLFADDMDNYLNNLEAIAPVSKRKIIKANRFQATLGYALAERKDLYNNKNIILGGRYFWSEFHGVDARVEFPSYSDSQLGQDITSQTGFDMTSKKASMLISSSYLYSPIYGKYAAGRSNLIRFDLYTISGFGLRFAEDQTQPFIQLGAGVNNYVWKNKLSIYPEYRLRLYGEDRGESVTVFDSLFQLGAAWIF